MVKRMILIVVVIALKALLCKGFALGIFLLLFWIKGKKLGFNSERWDDFFLQMPAQAVQRYAIGIYFAAAVISTAIIYCIFEAASYPYSLIAAIFLFIGGLSITTYRWNTTKEYLLNRYQEICETILERQGKM